MLPASDSMVDVGNFLIIRVLRKGPLTPLFLNVLMATRREYVEGFSDVNVQLSRHRGLQTRSSEVQGPIAH